MKLFTGRLVAPTMDAQCFTDAKSTLIASSCDDLSSLAPHGPAAARGADEAKLSQLLAMRVDLGSVKHHTAVVDYDNGSAMLYRSQIDDLDAEIAHYPFEGWWRWSYPCPKYLVESGAVRRDRGVPKRSKARHEANES